MKKKINILLLLAVLSLWGIAGYRFFKIFFLKPHNIVAAARNYTGAVPLITRDTFVLNPVSRDPFLDRSQQEIVPAKASLKSSGNRHAVFNKNIVVMPLQWPAVSYYGYIKPAKNEELAMIKINNVLFKMHEKDSKESITLKKIYKDSVRIMYNKQLKTIMRGKN